MSELPANVLSDAIHEDADAALWATILTGVTGFFWWLALWQRKTVRTPPPWRTPLVFVLALLSFAAMSRTAYIGVHIYHVELRPDVVARHKVCLDLVDQ